MHKLWFEVVMMLFMIAIYLFWSMISESCDSVGGTMVRGFGSWECIAGDAR